MSQLAAKFPLVRFLTNRSFEEAVSIYEQRIADATEVYRRFERELVARACPVCGGLDHEALEPFHGTYGVSACRACRTQFVNPAPSLAALSYYYNECKCNLMLAQLYRKRAADKGNFIISERTRYVVEQLRGMPAGRPLEVLEIGCSSGGFLADLSRATRELLPDHTIRFTGIDIDQNAVNSPVDPELELIAQPVEDYVKAATKRYDLVVHFELIEHLIDPFEFMRCVHRLLRPDGVHVFHTPNLCGLENVASPYNSLRLIAHAIFPPMHLNAFSTHNVTHFALRSGFGVVSIDTPGMLDVDMVRLCAEHLPADSPYAQLATFDEAQLGVLQAVVRDLGASSHMRCVLRKL